MCRDCCWTEVPVLLPAQRQESVGITRGRLDVQHICICDACPQLPSAWTGVAPRQGHLGLDQELC